MLEVELFFGVFTQHLQFVMYQHSPLTVDFQPILDFIRIDILLKEFPDIGVPLRLPKLLKPLKPSSPLLLDYGHLPINTPLLTTRRVATTQLDNNHMAHHSLKKGLKPSVTVEDVKEAHPTRRA